MKDAVMPGFRKRKRNQTCSSHRTDFPAAATAYKISICIRLPIEQIGRDNLAGLLQPMCPAELNNKTAKLGKVAGCRRTNLHNLSH
jgi:hypothetical protein